MAAMLLRDLFPNIKGLFGSSKQAAALPQIVDPKVPNKAQAQPSYSKRTKTSNGDQKLAATDRRTANLDLLTLRTGTTTKSTIHDLAVVSPDLSASNWAYARMVVTRGFMAVARNQDGTVHPEATNALQQVISRMNYLTDYSEGFTNISGLHAVAEALTKEFRLYGAGALELVLDKARLPSRLQPISTTQIDFFEDNKGSVYPVQKAPQGEINLDIPTFFYDALDQDLLTAYADSPMEAALHAALADAEFTQDVRRVIKRALHPRLDTSVTWEEFRKSIPASIAGDPDAVRAYQEQYIAAIEAVVNGLEPDDALVHFDTLEFKYLNNGNVSLNSEYSTLQDMTNAKLATGTKAPPAVLGHGSGSQNVASTESMLFVKYCEGVQNKINSLLSRSLTLATRLLGFDVYVEFAFERIDLRPDSELEAFKAQRQSRVLDLLSLGLLSDEDAALQLTGKLPPSTFKPLSGSMFRPAAGNTAQPDPNANNYSNTGTGGGAGGALNQSLTPDTSAQKRGAPSSKDKKNANP